MYWALPVHHETDLRWVQQNLIEDIPDSKVHGANIGPIWGRQDPGGPYVGPMNLAIREVKIGLGNGSVLSGYSHYLSQCLPRYMSPLGVIEPRWINTYFMMLFESYVIYQQCNINTQHVSI